MRRSIRTISLLAIIPVLAACGGLYKSEPMGQSQSSLPVPAVSTGDRSPGVMMNEADVARDEAQTRLASPPPPAPDQPAPPPQAADRKIIYTVDLRIEVEKFGESAAALEALVARFGGYSTNSSTQKQDNGAMYGDFTVKVDPAKLDQFVAEARKLGDVRSEAKSGQDVTMEFIDLEARMKTKRQLEEELLGLLRTSSPRLADKLEVERELARVREEIETTEGRLRYLKGMVGMATINVHLFEPLTVMPDEDNILWKAIKQAIEGLLESLGALIIFIAVTLPWLAAAAFFLWIVVRLWRWKRNRGAN